MVYKVGRDFVCGERAPNSVYWVISKIAVKFNGIELPFRVCSAVVNSTLGDCHRHKGFDLKVEWNSFHESIFIRKQVLAT